MDDLYINELHYFYHCFSLVLLIVVLYHCNALHGRRMAIRFAGYCCPVGSVRPLAPPVTHDAYVCVRALVELGIAAKFVFGVGHTLSGPIGKFIWPRRNAVVDVWACCALRAVSVMWRDDDSDKQHSSRFPLQSDSVKNERGSKSDRFVTGRPPSLLRRIRHRQAVRQRTSRAQHSSKSQNGMHKPQTTNAAV